MSQSESTQPTWCHELPTPIGPLLLACTGAGLTNVYFQSGPRPVQPQQLWRQDAQPFAEVERQLAEYFAGRRRVFELRLAPAGTDFQLLVWRALQKIPFGQTTSYGQIARDLGQRNAARAVGLANGSNPLPIIIPCHRVIGADGSLTGFGGGLDIKRALLRLEGADCVTDLFSTRDGDPALDDTHA
jgi:methylated-DNA-[protein]-cysteine S-methyltransferase